MSRQVTFSPEAREKLIKGVNILGDAVGATLGPKGRNVVIDTYGVPTVTKDGVTVAREVKLVDRLEDLGAHIIKQAAQKTGTKAGDGTTTATVLAQALVNRGYKLVSDGVSPIEIKRGYEDLLEEALTFVLGQSKPVTSENIKQIATISANNDEKIGGLIHKGFEFVGMNGMMAVEDSKTGETYVDTIEGAQINTGYVSPYLVTNPEKMHCEYEKPLILLTDKKIRTSQELIPIMDIAHKANRPLIVIADEIEAHALGIMILNKVKGGFPIAAVRAPAFGERRLEILKDLAIITGGEVISDAKGQLLEKVTLEQLGTTNKILITKEETLFMGPKANKEALEVRIKEVQNLLSDPTNGAYVTEKLNERLSNLTGKIAVLHVGAATETEMKEKKDRIDDALRATKSAITLGYVKGGGLTLFLAAQHIGTSGYVESDKPLDPIKEAFFSSLNAPYKLIQKNANINNIPPMSDSEAINCLTGQFVNFEEAGIIDPTLVIIEALTNAVSAANMVLLSEVVISDDQPKYDPRAGDPDLQGYG